MSATATREATLVRVVTATRIVFNDRRSFKFMFDGKMPGGWVGQAGLWGFVELKKKDGNYFDPWAWAASRRGESDRPFVGDDGTPRWDIGIFESGKGLHLSCGFDDDPALEGWRTLVREGSLPPVTVLCMERPLFDRLAPVLAEEGVTVEVHHFESELVSS